MLYIIFVQNILFYGSQKLLVHTIYTIFQKKQIDKQYILLNDVINNKLWKFDFGVL